MSPPSPLIGRFSHLLPLLALDGGHFESFGCETAERVDGLTGVRIYGRSGQTQYGIDVYGYRGDGQSVVYQMRCREERLTPAKLRKAVKDYFTKKQPFTATRFELCWAGHVSDVAIDDQLVVLRSEHPGKTIMLRDQAQFTADLISHRDLALRWFGESTTDAVYGARASTES